MPVWQKLEEDPRTASANIDMCAAGMRDYDDPSLFIRKATTIKASCERLLTPLRKFKCDGNHDHQPIEGKCSDGESRSHKCRVWPWKLASTIAASIADLIRYHYTYHTNSYPVASVQVDGEDPTEPGTVRRRSNRLDWPCPACCSSNI